MNLICWKLPPARRLALNSRSMPSWMSARAWSPVEWKLHDGGGCLPIAYFNLDTVCVGWQRGRYLTGAQVGHRNRAPHAWTHGAAGDNSHFAAGTENPVAPPRDATSIVGFDADEPLARSPVVLRAKRGLSHEPPTEPDESVQTCL